MHHGGRAVVVVLGPEFMLIDLRMACEGHELGSLSWCGRKSLLLLDQLCIFLFICQSLPGIDVNASLRSDDESLTTAYESKKSRMFQLVNRSKLVTIRCKPSINDIFPMRTAAFAETMMIYINRSDSCIHSGYC